MADDARISTALPEHPKTVKLRRRLGDGGGWSLICLFLYAAGNRYDGDLSGMTNEDIEIAAKWVGTAGCLVAALVEVRFLDGEEGSYRIHDWVEHNPWAATRGLRMDAAKHAANVRWEAVRKAMACGAHAEGTPSAQKGNAHLTSPHLTTPQKPKACFLPPSWVSSDVWQAFEEMRKSIKKPLSEFSRKQIINKLSKWREGGHNPDSILSASIENCWAGVFEPKSFFKLQPVAVSKSDPAAAMRRQLEAD